MSDYYRDLLKKYIANSMELYFSQKSNVFLSNLHKFEYDAREIDEVYEIIRELDEEFSNRG